MNWDKVLVHVNGCLGTLICRNKFKKFNYTKIHKSNLKMTYSFTDFSIIEFFFLFSKYHMPLICQITLLVSDSVNVRNKITKRGAPYTTL